MTTTEVRSDAPPRPHRLLDPGPLGPLPQLSERQLIDLVEACGLTGRGGAGFPTAIKVHAVATGRRRPVVVANGMEGEPLSHKDAVLLTRSPELVLDGLELVGRALRAHRMVLAVGPEIDPHPVFEAAASRRHIDVLHLQGGFVAGQESALLNQIEGRPAVPRDPLTRVTDRGVDGRPTLVSNAETLAHLALAARFGAASRESHLELTAEILAIRVAEQEICQRVGVRGDVERLRAADSGKWATRDVPDRVAAGFARRQAGRREIAHRQLDVVQLDEVELDVLPRGDVAELARVLLPRRRQRVELGAVENALRNLHPQHRRVVGLPLTVGAAHQAERPPLVGRDLAALVLFERRHELVDVGHAGK